MSSAAEAQRAHLMSDERGESEESYVNTITCLSKPNLDLTQAWEGRKDVHWWNTITSLCNLPMSSCLWSSKAAKIIN